MDETTTAPVVDAVATDGDATSEAPVVETPVVPEPKAPPRTFKGKVNGREVDLSEDEVISAGTVAAQVRRAANEQFQQAQKMRQEVEAFRESLSKDPIAGIEQILGGSGKFREMAEQYLLREIQMEQMNPQQRAYMQAQQALQAEQAKVAEYQRAEMSQKEQIAAEQYRSKYNEEFTAALKDGGLPKTTETVRRMATLTEKALKMGLDLSAKDIAKLVKQDIVEEQSKTIAALDGEMLLAALGPDLLKKIRTADLAKLKAAKPMATPPQPVVQQRPGKPERYEPNPHLKTRAQMERAGRLDPKNDRW